MNCLDPAWVRSSNVIDSVQFPQQTLAFKEGKASDLSVLFCALFESVGIHTGFVFVPGQVFMAFSLEMGADEARRTFPRADDLIFRGDTVWLPMEVTSLGGEFLEVWHKGAKEWREGVVKVGPAFIH